MKNQKEEEILIIKRPLKNSKKPKIIFSPTPGFNPDPVIIQEPQDEIGQKYYKTIKQFCQSTEIEMDFPHVFEQNEKQRIHQLAEDFNLNHYKRGTNQKKFITLQKRNHLPKDQFQYIGYIGLFGPQVDQAAKLSENFIPFQYIHQSYKRDGPVRHITLMLKQDILKTLKKVNEIQEYSQYINQEKWKDNKLECLMDVISNVIEDDWKDYGLGNITTENNSSYFKVIEWSSASKFRKSLGLEPQDFSITIGFKNLDIHDIPKSKDTLIKESPIKPINHLREMEDFLDYLEIPPYHCRTFLMNGWNVRNIRYISLQDIKEFGMKHEYERTLMNWICNFSKNFEIYEKRKKDNCFI